MTGGTPVSGTGCGSAAAGPPPPCNLLLVSDSRRWARAVQVAAAELGCGFSQCDARGAVARLAGSAPRYSHLLLHPDSAGGLLDELVQLTAGAHESGTEILLLGRTAQPPPRTGTIPSADRRTVRQALASALPERTPHETSMHPAELREALDGAMIETRYQPIVRLADRQPVALEVLARLNHPTRGTLPPEAFIAPMENAGLAAQLTDLVAARAMADIAGPVLGPHAFNVTLNFPLDVLLVPEVLERVEAQRQALGLVPGRVQIELTESQAVEDLARLGAVLERLRAGGYRVAIDDIGPAMPRMAELLDLPFSGLKLDKDVVRTVHTDLAMQHYAQWLIETARTRELTVVAEGVEDIATWQRMQALGVDLAQGFLVARPLPLAAVLIWLESWRSQ
ncbi:MAG TPA: EAL domain-containing protein [Acetobacteraceae bacterium]|nr:EAL domain-containing protein [Acetobacteraceae bacterium]